jgi:hypothetical protein
VRPGRQWPLAVLSAAVGALALVVPSLLPDSRRVPPVPARTASPSPSATAVRSPSAAARPRPAPASSGSPRPAAAPFVVAATDRRNKRVGVSAIDCPTCASGSRIQYVGQGHALIVPLRVAGASGPRTLVITYESQGERPLDVLVNSGPVISLRLAGKDSWTTPAQVKVPITLSPGNNRITFFHATAPAPDLDRIEVR